MSTASFHVAMDNLRDVSRHNLFVFRVSCGNVLMHLMQQDHSCVLNSLNTWWASQNSKNLSQAAQRPLRWIPKPWDRLKPVGRSGKVVMSTWDPYNREEASRCPENTGGVLICRRISKSHNLRSSGGPNIKTRPLSARLKSFKYIKPLHHSLSTSHSW